jgi:hypothetical protein
MKKKTGSNCHLRPSVNLEEYWRSLDELEERIESAIQDIIDRLPEPGSGLNTGILRAAHALKYFCGRDEIIDRLIPIVSAKRGRDCTREVTRQVNTAFGCTGAGGGGSFRRGSQWPEYESDLWRRMNIPEVSFGDLWNASPVKFTDGEPHTREVLEALFQGDPLLCFGRSTYDFFTARLSEVSDETLHSMPLIVPNAARAETGLTQEGKVSQHAKEMFPYRNYIVVEFDSIEDKAQQASIIMWLAKHWDLRLVVDSRGKSLHAWFYAGGIDDVSLEYHFAKAVRLGADPRTFTISQFVRLPDGLRDNEKRQDILYFKSNE